SLPHPAWRSVSERGCCRAPANAVNGAGAPDAATGTVPRTLDFEKSQQPRQKHTSAEVHTRKSLSPGHTFGRFSDPLRADLQQFFNGLGRTSPWHDGSALAIPHRADHQHLAERSKRTYPGWHRRAVSTRNPEHHRSPVQRHASQLIRSFEGALSQLR